MTQTEMLKVIARHGYNVGFGAKKNFATYDIICKASGWISFISLAVGVFALFTPQLATNTISAVLIIFGVATMYIQFYEQDKSMYESAGIAQTEIFNELELLYRSVKTDAGFDHVVTQESVRQLMKKFYGTTVSKQIFGSNWYAHYKFFCEFEKRWVADELGLTLKDKVPLSFCLFAVVVVILAVSLY